MDDDKIMLHNLQAKRVRQKMISVADICHEKIHWGSSMSCVEILIYLLSEASNFSNQSIEDLQRDVVIVSKGHAALAQYAVMEEMGLIKDDFAKFYQKNGSKYPEELIQNTELQIVCTTGSLGLGLPYAVGMSIYEKRHESQRKIFCLVGDGECDEGSVWEAIMLAAQQKLDQLVMVVDCNGLQSDGDTDGIISWKNIRAQMEAFGWTVRTVDGHKFESMDNVFDPVEGKPTAIIAKTIKGKGISFMEYDATWHDRILDKEFLKQAKTEVGL